MIRVERNSPNIINLVLVNYLIDFVCMCVCVDDHTQVQVQLQLSNMQIRKSAQCTAKNLKRLIVN